MKLNIEVANFIDRITAQFKMPVAVEDNGKVMWVYDYEERKRFSITAIVRNILDGADLTMLKVEDIERLCYILPNRKERELALATFLSDSDYMGEE